MEQGVANPQLISLAAGLVDLPSLPVDEVLAAAEAILRSSKGLAALQYGTTPGDARFRTLLAEYLNRLDDEAGGRHNAARAENIIVGTGSQQLLYLAAEILVDPGDIVLLGVPAYFVFMGTLQSFGVQMIGVESDKDGIVPEAVDEVLRALHQQGQLSRVKFVYEPSYFNNPTGCSLSVSRRQQLLEIVNRWSVDHRIHIIEDAAYRELRYRGSDKPSIWSFDVAGQTVLYAGTFSKPFAPGMKTGYMAVPEALVEPMVHQKGHHDFGSSNFVQQILATCMEDGSYDRQLQKVRGVYSRKCEVMLQALRDGLGSVCQQVGWTEPEGGLYVWLELPENVATTRDSQFFRCCLDAGVLYVPGDYCYPREYPKRLKNCLRLSFGVQSEQGIREGVRRLCSVIERLAGTS